MIKRTNKHFALLLVLAMLATMFVGVGTASAASENRVNKILSVADDFDGVAATLTIQEDSDYPDDFVVGDSFMVSLPAGVNWNPVAYTTNNAGFTVNAVVSSDQVLDITFTAVQAGAQDILTIDLDILVDGFAEGDITAKVEGLDSGVSDGTYVFARVAGGKSIATAMSVETIGENGVGGNIRLQEAAAGSLGNGVQEITFKLPSHFAWDEVSATLNNIVSFSGGFTGLVFVPVANPVIPTANGTWSGVINGRDLTISINPPDVARTQRGLITIETPIDADNDANYGDVEVAISGDEVDDADVVVATFADFGVKLKVDSVEDIMSGKYAQELDTITLEEMVPGTLIENRDVTFTFPTWVKITDVTVTDSNGLVVSTPTVVADTGDVDGTDNSVDVTIETSTTTTNGKLKLDFEISVEANKSGDIEMTVSSKNAGVTETKLVVGKAIAAVTATSDGSKDLKIGAQAQELSDITIKEVVAGAISDENDSAMGENLYVTLPAGAKFAGKPKVEVIEGNIDIDEDALDLVTATTSDDRLLIPVLSSSSKISTIKVSGIKVTLDRNVPEGDFKVNIGGGAIAENQSANTEGWLNGAAVAGASSTLDEGEFDTATVVGMVGAKVVTPAPGEIENTTVFTIASTSYVMNGVTKTMDVAPYVKDNRTYMPIRYVAYALGIDDSNIIWDGASQTVTLMKGDKVVQLKIGSKTILINGATVTMDVAPELASDRTMLPAALVANAFGATATWDGTASTVTIK